MSYNKETGMYEGFIYCITNTLICKQYIGQTRCTIEKRYKEHLKNSIRSKSKDKKPLYIDIQEYGRENFQIQQIEKVESSNIEDLVILLNQKEIFYIEELNTCIPNGYNVQTKVNNIYAYNHPTNIPLYKFDINGKLLEHYNSMQEAQISLGVTIINEKMRKACNEGYLYKGFRWSYKDIYDKNLLGNYSEICPERGTSRSKNVFQFDLEGNLIQKWDSVRKAEKFIETICSGNKKSTYAISNACINGNGYAYGYLWSYSTTPPVYIPAKEKLGKRVNQLTKDKKLIRSYVNIKEASRITKIQHSGITRVCQGLQSHAGGYIWKYSVNKESV